jgi:hypothetical protein
VATASVWSSGLTTVVTGVFGVATGNPIAAVTGAIGFAGWLVERFQDASEETDEEERPTITLSEAVNSISPPENPPAAFQAAASKENPTRASDKRAVEGRAKQIARSEAAGTDFDNRIRAVIELKVAQRAEEIARSPQSGTDEENWLRAERELQIAYRAEEIASSAESGRDYDNWIRAEHEFSVAHRAEEIARSPDHGSDIENWVRAERELEAERTAVATRAEEIARLAETAIAIRLHVEVMIRAEEIAGSEGAGDDFDNWRRAEEELSPRQTVISDRARAVASSPEAALGNWLRAERELRAIGQIGTHWPTSSKSPRPG